VIFKALLSATQGASQVFRNKAMSFASLFSITAIMLILGLFFIIVVNINNTAEGVKQDFDTIEIHLLDETDEAETQALVAAFLEMPDVENAEYLTKEQNLEKWREKWGDNDDLLDRLRTNPLPNSIVIEADDIQNLDAIVARAQNMEGIERINYSQNTVNKLLGITKTIQVGALIVIAFLVFISIVVVSNTVKLTVLAREKEINIMKYVGATNWFIRGPFLMEGMIIGVISAIISACLVWGLYAYIVRNFGVDFLLYISAGLVPVGFLIKNLVIIFLALGISIGACGSIVSMRRFLDT
jgi:cell division transport system permease protein